MSARTTDAPRFVRLVRLYALLAGGCDVATGLLLVAAPAFTLRLMGVHDAITELVWMRFVGAFVASVGALYLQALLPPRQGGPLARVRPALEATALVRTGIALFVGVSVATGALSAAWLSVFATDAAFAALQVVLLRRPEMRDAS